MEKSDPSTSHLTEEELEKLKINNEPYKGEAV